MLKVNKGFPSGRDGFVQAPPVSSLKEVAKSFTGFFGRQFKVFLIFVPCAIALGLVYLLVTPPSFTADALLLIDVDKAQSFQQSAQQQRMNEPTDSSSVQTQVEILKSKNVNLAVFNSLKLAEDPEFVGTTGIIGAIYGQLDGIFRKFVPAETQFDDTQFGEKQFEQLPNRRAFEVFNNHLTVSRVGLTYVLKVSFLSINPAKAARIANAVCQAYINDLLEAKYEAARHASGWLQDRINSLRADYSAAERAVTEFKQQHNLIESSGKLMNDQQMSEVNSQLILIQAATAEARARLNSIERVLSQEDIADASVTDSLKNEVIIKLRQQYLELAGRASIWTKKYGPDHLAVVAARSQMAELRRNITDEMRKIAQSYKSEYEIALTRENSIRKSLASTVTVSLIAGQAQAQLRELESTAQTSRAMYDTFLQRHMEAVQQQSFPISEARLISQADPPLKKSQPNRLIVLAGAAIGGMMLAFTVAILREASDNVFRTKSQVEEILEVNCLAVLPFLKRVEPNTDGKHGDTYALAQQRSITLQDTLLRYVVDLPFSQFTESVRSLKVLTDLKNQVEATKVIGITSTLPSEGKSTLAANFANFIAHAGSRVILVDADLRRPSLSHSLSPAASTGLIDVLAGETTLDNAIWTDHSTGLVFLPAGPTAEALLHPNEILASVAIKSLIESLRSKFDYVIVDFPPLAPVVDTRATTTFIDSYVYVIEWGRTKIDIVETILFNACEVYDRLLGVVLNKAKVRSIEGYGGYGSGYYRERGDHST